MVKLIHFIQSLSIDITAGAVIMTLFVAQVFGVSLDHHMVIGLAIAIWLIYTVDHLLDAKKSKMEAANPRHAFHQKYFKQIIGLALIVFALGLWNLKFLPESTILFGLFLAGTSGIYLIYSYLSKKPFSKELFAAFVYTAGIVTAPLSLMNEISWYELLLMAQLLTLAYANLLIIPLFEHDIDVQDKHASVATLKGASTVKQRVLLICSFNAIFVVVQFYGPLPQAIPTLFASMTFVLFTLINRQELFRKFQLFRILADGIFFLPGIYLLL